MEARVSIIFRCTLVHRGRLGVGGILGNLQRCSLTLSSLWAGADVLPRAATACFDHRAEGPPKVHSGTRQHRFLMHISAPRPFGSWRDPRESPAMQFGLKFTVGGRRRAPTCSHGPVLTIRLKGPSCAFRYASDIGSRCTLLHRGRLGVGGIPGNPQRCSLTLSSLWAGTGVRLRATKAPF